MDINNFDFSNSRIIKPPTADERKQFINTPLIDQKLIMIDSRDRNINLYNKNNDFIIELDEPINDVSEIELVSANMPINSYNINLHNNRLYFFENSITDLSQTYDIANPDLYNDGIIDETKIFYIKIIPNNYHNSKSIIDYLTLNNHYVYKLSDSTIVKLASLRIEYNTSSCKYNIAIFTADHSPNNIVSEYIDPNTVSLSADTINAKKNCIIFRGNKYIYNSKTMYNYLPNSAHEIFGFDLNYGFINYNALILEKDFLDYGLNHELNSTTNTNTSGFTTTLSTNIYINISNTMASNKTNEYVLLHLPSLPKMTNKIASNNIVQNAYTKLHLGTGATRNVFFGRIKAFTNVYILNPSIKLSKLHIRLTDYNGNLFDFNNSNFTLTFSITYNKQPHYYNY